MRSVKRLAVVVATAAAGLVIAGGTANAAGISGVATADQCAPHYTGAVGYTAVTGTFYVCQNIY